MSAAGAVLQTEGLLAAPTFAERHDGMRPTGVAPLDPVRAETTAPEAPTATAQASYLRARLFAERGDLDAALHQIIGARAQFELAGEHLKAARTDLGRMQILDDMGRPAEALQVGEALVRRVAGIEVTSAKETHLRAIITASALGNCGIAHGLLGHHHQSLAAYARAEAAYAVLGMPDQAALWQSNRGVELLGLGKVRAATEVLAASAATFREIGDEVWQAVCEMHLADAQRLSGNLVSALATLARAQEVLQRLGSDPQLARVHLHRARVYLNAGLSRQAAVAAMTAVDIAARAGMRRERGIGLLIAASSWLALGEPEECDRDLSIAEELFRAVGDPQLQARAVLVRVDLLAMGGHREEAVSILAGAITELLRGGWTLPAGWALLRAHALAESRETQAKILDQAALLADELALPELTIAVQQRRAHQLRENGDCPGAIATLRDVRARIDQLGSALHTPSLMVAFAESKRSTADDLVHLLATSGTDPAIREAIAVSDRAKAQTLSELVTQTLGMPASSGTEVCPVEELRAGLSGVYAALHDTMDPYRREALHAYAAEIEAALVDAQVQRSVHQFGTDLDRDPRQTAPARVDRAPGLAFHVAGDDIVAFVVDGQDAHGVLLTGAYRKVRGLTSDLSSQWTRVRVSRGLGRRHENRLARTTQALLKDLYDVLVAPLAKHLDHLPGDRLTIAPDRLLHQVPFHALYDGRRYLLDRWAITLSPTTSAAVAGNEPGGSAPRVAFVGVPDAQAPHIEAEIRELAARVPGATRLLGDEATVDAVTAAAGGANVLHLACHGMYRAENALFSSLRLADRWWTCSEVLDLNLTDTTVVLTACESGKSGDTAEPIGLAWGFLAAGARSAVVSQWVLDDRVPVKLMATFYDHLGKGEDVAFALRAAQLAVRREFRHPYYWASLTHVSSPFEPRTDQ